MDGFHDLVGTDIAPVSKKPAVKIFSKHRKDLVGMSTKFDQPKN